MKELGCGDWEEVVALARGKKSFSLPVNQVYININIYIYIYLYLYINICLWLFQHVELPTPALG